MVMWAGSVGIQIDHDAAKRIAEQQPLPKPVVEQKMEELAATIAKEINRPGDGTIGLCVPPIPLKPHTTTQCEARSASAKLRHVNNVTIKLSSGGISLGQSEPTCYEINIYGGSRYAHGNTCGGVQEYWAVRVENESGSASGLTRAIAWLLMRI